MKPFFKCEWFTIEIYDSSATWNKSLGVWLLENKLHQWFIGENNILLEFTIETKS